MAFFGFDALHATIFTVKFLSDEWVAALAAAAKARRVPADGAEPDPLAGVSVTVEQIVEGVVRWRMIVDDGAITIRKSAPDDAVADVRLSCTKAVARSIASGTRPALDAFIDGDLRIGGDVGQLLANLVALESMGDLFAGVRAETTFD